MGKMREDEGTRKGRKWKADKHKWGVYRFIFVTSRARMSLKTSPPPRD